MNILVTGATGFIGTHLTHRLLSQKHQLWLYVRNVKSARRLWGDRVQYLTNLADLPPDAGIDAAINLAGESIAKKRWSPTRKRILIDSRVDTTEALILALSRQEKKPEVLLNASAVGYYGDQGAQEVTETTLPHPEFSHELCKLWEQTAEEGVSFVNRVCILRLGLVVGAGGGFLKRMLPAFRVGLGGHFGHGRQYMSWVHLEDVIGVLLYLLHHPQLTGTFNLTSPEPVTNRDFTKALARELHRPALLPVPASVLKMMMGEMSTLLLTGQKVLPQRLLASGYQFRYPSLESALQEALT